MKIINLQGENFKRMSAFDITPKGNTVIISGENGQGKTSVLDAIVMALAGKNSDVAKLTTKPIKAGETHASVTVTTDTYVITRKWTEKDTYLEMTNRDGMVFKSPQTLLDSIIGDLCFDPLEFTRLKPKEQRDMLLGIVKLPIDLDEWQRQYDFKYEERKSIGTQGKAIKGKLETMPHVPDGTPEDEVNMAVLLGKIEQREKLNFEYKEKDMEIQKNRELIDELKRRLAEAEHERDRLDAEMEGLNWEDTTEMRKQLEQAEETNRNVRLRAERAKAAEDVEKHEKAYAEHTAQMEAMQEEKAAALRAAAFPIKGLAFDDEGVTFDNFPFAQLSGALQLKVSMAIAMAKNPQLRVIRITDGSLLDEKNMEVLKEMADRNDFQVWVEKVDSSGKVGIVIHDGAVVSNQQL